MFDKLLVANRGEIAYRVIRTAKRMGIRCVAVYSSADAKAQHVLQADEAVLVGDSVATASYLNIDAILTAAKLTGAQAIHPGYGFLSENAEFARACEAAGITFIGPTAYAIELMGSKIAAKNTVAAAGTPVVPGYQGQDQAPDVLAAQALQVGFPLLIKASAGGGGKGMRLVQQASEFEAALESAKREAQAAFADDKVLLEKYLTAPKHIEVQVLGDGQGHVVHLFERDCSVQRRHQKVIEEAPGPTIDKTLRARLGAAAVQAAAAINYRGAGTIEFIAEGDEFFFMEMNTRLQVEHPVTEAITGLDLVEWQLRIAAGQPLTLTQADMAFQGHAIEARLYAENPHKKFLPASGPLHHVQFPEQIRVDSGVVSGDRVGTFYDPMLAKLIAYGANREDARAQLLTALRETQVVGITSNLDYLIQVLQLPEFVAGDYTTGTVEEAHEALTPPANELMVIVAALGYQQIMAHRVAPATSCWITGGGFRQNLPRYFALRLRQRKQVQAVVQRDDAVELDDVRYQLIEQRWHKGKLSVVVADERAQSPQRLEAQVHYVGDTLYCVSAGRTLQWQIETNLVDLDNMAGGGNQVLAPMPGQVIALPAEPGRRVRQGETLVVIEAMKMEHSLVAPHSGVIELVSCEVGGKVDEGQMLIQLQAPEA